MKQNLTFIEALEQIVGEFNTPIAARKHPEMYEVAKVIEEKLVKLKDKDYLEKKAIELTEAECILDEDEYEAYKDGCMVVLKNINSL